MSRLKVGVLGCGSIAKYRHLPEFAENKHVKIVALCDVNEERVKKKAEQYGATAYTDYEEMLEKEALDLVSICLPNHLHASATIAALNKGCHVLCEKPMATSKDEAEAMIAAAEENGKQLMIAHNQRFVASHEKAKELIENGEIGKVYSFRTTFGHGGPEGWSADGRDSWFFRKEEAFIGAMGDLGVHKADLIRYLLGEEVVEVGAFVETSAKGDTDVDDNAVCVLKMESGIVGTLVASWSYNAFQDNSTVIYGEKAIIRLEDDPDHSLIVHYTDGEIDRYDLDKIQTNEEGGQTTSYVIDHFVEAIVEGKEVPISGVEGKKSLEVVLAALQSNEEKKIVSL